MIKNWVGFYTLSSREVLRFFTVWKQTIIPGIITTLLYIFVFGVALESRIDPIAPGVSYKMYILPGLLMMNVITNSVANTASSMLQMKLLGQLPDILQAPLSSFEISLAYIIGGMVRGTVNGVLILLVGVGLSDMTVAQPLATIGFIMLVSWAFSSIGLILGQMAESWDQLATMQNFFLTPLSFLGGIFYSIKMLPEWAQGASFFNPIYYMINGLRYTILGVSDSNPSTSFIIAIIMTIGFSVVAIMLMENGKKIKQ